MTLKLLERKQIDDKLWNGCVHFALNPMPYAYTWYLDNVAPEWMGIVEGNYQKVMPIVFNKKWGINYIYQPKFCQQLGIFSDLPLSKETINKFFEFIPDSFRYIEMALNESNIAPSGFDIEVRSNFVLPLDAPYEILLSSYNTNNLDRINNAQKVGLILNTQLSPEKFVDFYVKNMGPKVENFIYKDKYTLLRIIYKALSYNVGQILGIERDGDLVSVSFLLIHPQRIINLLPASNNEGKKHYAQEYLIDKVIEKNAGQKKYLDFGIGYSEDDKSNFKSFGAEVIQYNTLIKNELPTIMKWGKSFFQK